MRSEASKEQQRLYDKANTVSFGIKLNRTTDADIIARLEAVGNRQAYLKKLVRADLATKTDTEN